VGTDLERRTLSAVGFTNDQVELIKSQICRPSKRAASDDELAMFIGQCERTGLDPFAKQIYAIFRWDSRAGAEKMTIQVSIDGFRLVAERTGKYAGQDGPFWCDEDGNWTDTWLRKEPPKAAKVIVKKVLGGVVAETPAVAHWNEYAVTGSAGRFWNDKPALMIGKCAEALALRKAFPQELSGLYTSEEMAQADVSPVSVPAAPTVLAATDAQKKRIKGLLTKNKIKTIEDARPLFREVTGRELEGKFADGVASLSREEATRMIDRLLQGAVPTGGSDLGEVVDGEFVHPKPEGESEFDPVEAIKTTFDAKEEAA
jgi:phage recombination protein Bet